MNCQSDSQVESKYIMSTGMRKAWPGCDVFLKASSLDVLDVLFPLEKTCVMRAALRPLPELVESVLADFKTAAALQHRQAASLLSGHMEALQGNLQPHDLLGALQIQVHFCFTKPVEQSLLSRLTEAMLWIRNSEQRCSNIADLGLQFSVSVVDLAEYL